MKSFFVLLLLTCLSAGAHAQSATVINELNHFIDAWHKAAADANEKLFFGCIADNGIYIGTDATERWTKPEFLAYAKPYFDKGKAWTFTPHNRDFHVTSEGNFAWFSELLTTRMGTCRGSGILRKTADGWKIEQYHLSVTVPNEAMKDFIALMDSYQHERGK
ncbi:MAG TPA: nuclear transport factor 2 family protein [Ohtaekwangia sp.]|uniref:nuclear transport factor 2 family protein n=1 Tax=Ohtaekwangia sp. TaxID=2066019 RepID=UPI002F928E03